MEIFRTLGSSHLGRPVTALLIFYGKANTSLHGLGEYDMTRAYILKWLRSAGYPPFIVILWSLSSAGFTRCISFIGWLFYLRHPQIVSSFIYVLILASSVANIQLMKTLTNGLITGDYGINNRLKALTHRKDYPDCLRRDNNLKQSE